MKMNYYQYKFPFVSNMCIQWLLKLSEEQFQKIEDDLILTKDFL